LLSTFEARFNVTPEVSGLLAQNASHWSLGLNKAWSLRYRQGLKEKSAYAELCKLGFTSKQVGSILIAVDMLVGDNYLGRLKVHCGRWGEL
jgi:hypothetical protein